MDLWGQMEDETGSLHFCCTAKRYAAADKKNERHLPSAYVPPAAMLAHEMGHSSGLTFLSSAEAARDESKMGSIEATHVGCLQSTRGH